MSSGTKKHHLNGQMYLATRGGRRRVTKNILFLKKGQNIHLGQKIGISVQFYIHIGYIGMFLHRFKGTGTRDLIWLKVYHWIDLG